MGCPPTRRWVFTPSTCKYNHVPRPHLARVHGESRVKKPIAAARPSVKWRIHEAADSWLATETAGLHPGEIKVFTYYQKSVRDVFSIELINLKTMNAEMNNLTGSD